MTVPASCAGRRRSRSTFPAGIDTGKRVRMAGQGGPGLNGGPAGDVNLVVSVRPDRRFTREGDDLRTEVDVPVTTAVLGGEVEVTTPTGRVALENSGRDPEWEEFPPARSRYAEASLAGQRPG